MYQALFPCPFFLSLEELEREVKESKARAEKAS